jgi:hypothetical protein
MLVCCPRRMCQPPGFLHPYPHKAHVGARSPFRSREEHHAGVVVQLGVRARCGALGGPLQEFLGVQRASARVSPAEALRHHSRQRLLVPLVHGADPGLVGLPHRLLPRRGPFLCHPGGTQGQHRHRRQRCGPEGASCSVGRIPPGAFPHAAPCSVVIVKNTCGLPAGGHAWLAVRSPVAGAPPLPEYACDVAGFARERL